jgi:hypothetical protein
MIVQKLELRKYPMNPIPSTEFANSVVKLTGYSSPRESTILDPTYKREAFIWSFPWV